MSETDLAMLIEAIAKRGDPLDRFVSSLPEQLRRHAEETIRLRDELVHHTQSLLTTETNEATLHAEWLRRHAHDVAFRWSGLRSSALRWAMFDVDSFTIRLPGSQR